MVGFCQDPVPNTSLPGVVVAIAGPAGSGKTTLGRALARALDVPLLDLDSLTNPLLDHLGDVFDGAHWNSAGAHSAAVRIGRYAVLRSAAADLVSVGQTPVLVAPFTSELTDGPLRRELLSSVAPAELLMVHLDGPSELFARRRAARGSTRDQHRPESSDRPSPPSIPHLRVDAAASTDEQIAAVVGELRRRRP